MDFYWREDRIIETNFIFYILHSRLIFRHEWSNTLKPLQSTLIWILLKKKKSISPHEFETIPIKFLSKKKIVSDNPP